MNNNNIQFLITELMAHTIHNYFKRFPTQYSKEPDIWTKMSYILDSYVHTYSRPEFDNLSKYLTYEQINLIFQEILETIEKIETGY